MINKFENYSDLINYINHLSDSAMHSVDAIKKLKILVEKGKFTIDYYNKQNSSLKLLAEELSSCLLLKKDILNSKTNEELINMILDNINNDENKYRVRIMQVSGYNSLYELDKLYFDTYPLTEEEVLFSIFLVRNDIPDNNLVEQIHDKEKYQYLTKNKLVIDLKTLLTSITAEEIKEFLNDKTINLNSIVGLSEEIREQILERLFEDYKKENKDNIRVKKY